MPKKRKSTKAMLLAKHDIDLNTARDHVRSLIEKVDETLNMGLKEITSLSMNRQIAIHETRFRKATAHSVVAKRLRQRKIESDLSDIKGIDNPAELLKALEAADGDSGKEMEIAKSLTRQVIIAQRSDITSLYKTAVDSLKIVATRLQTDIDKHFLSEEYFPQLAEVCHLLTKLQAVPHLHDALELDRAPIDELMFIVQTTLAGNVETSTLLQEPG